MDQPRGDGSVGDGGTAKESVGKNITNEAMLSLLKQHITAANTDMKTEITDDFKQMLRPINDQIGINAAEINKNTRAISDIQISLARLHREREKADHPVRRGDNLQLTSLQSMDEDSKRDRYNISRRSVRVWPVDGTNDQEIGTNAELFLMDILLIPRDLIDEVRPFPFPHKKNNYPGPYKNKG